MAEHDRVSSWIVVWCLLLLTLFTVLVVYASRPRQPGGKPIVVPAPLPARATVKLWLSTGDRRLRLVQQPDIDLGAQDGSPADVVIDTGKTYQSIVGFGAALTDSSAWLMQYKLDQRQRSALLQELFGPPPNLNLNMTRLTIGASDFSLKQYTLDDLPTGQVDPGLQHFNVAANLLDVIPTVHEAMAFNPRLRIIASSWSAPAWMKTSANLIGGELLPQYESTYADYLVKYVDTFRRYGIPIFALTLQNEPGFVPITYPGMELSARTQERIITQYLGPALASRKPKTLFLTWDHNWDDPEQPLSVLADPDAARHVDGVAWHCYRGDPRAQGQVHNAYPKKDAYITECSGGDWASSKNGELLWFARNLLLGGLRNWAHGVVYWNLALDENYGPHTGGCDTCKGIVTIDSRTGAITRNDYYYAFAHFSRFVLPGAFRVKSTATDHGLVNVAFQNAASGSVVLVMINSDSKEHPVSVSQDQTRFHYSMPPESVATLVWSPGRASAGADTTTSSAIGKVPATTATSELPGARSVAK
jgi:glucosylceramidase